MVIVMIALGVLLVAGFFAVMFSAMASKRSKGHAGPKATHGGPAKRRHR